MESSMDDAIDYLIIHLIKKEPFMYDKRNSKYLKKNQLKYDLFEIISQAIYQEFQYDLSVQAIERRWNALLKRYGSEKAKLKIKPKSGSGANDKESEKWVLFDELIFLDEPTLKHRKVTSSLSTIAMDSKKRPVNDLPWSIKNVTDKMPPEESFSKRRKTEIGVIDKEIGEMKNIIKEAMKNITKPTVTINQPDKEKNLESDRFIEAIRKGLQRVPIENVLDCLIRVKEITKNYRNAN